MRYRNKRTGIIINIDNNLVGGDWEKLAEENSAKTSTKKAGEKSGTVRNNRRCGKSVEKTDK